MTIVHRKGSKNLYMDFVVKGKRVCKSTGTSDPQKAREIEAQARRKALLECSSVSTHSLQGAVERGMSTRWARTKDREKVRRRLHKALEFFGADTPLESIKAKDVASYRDWLVASGKAPGTVNRYLANLKTLFKMAQEEWEVVDMVPRIKLLKEAEHRLRFFSEQELETVLEHLREAGKDDLADLYEVLVDTGMRLGEALGLTSANVDLEQGVITLYGDQVKSGKVRAIPMTDRVREILQVRLADGTGDGRHPFRMSKFHVSHTMQDTLKKVGLYGDGLCVHSLRHTFASRLVQKGVPLYTVKDLLGHQSIQMTERYSHLRRDDLGNAIQLLNVNSPAA